MIKRLKIATFSKIIHANTTRMFENIFDWEHLPHVHPSSFSSVRCFHLGAKSLQCEVGLSPHRLGLKQNIQVYACEKRLLWIVTIKQGFLKGLTIRSRLTVLSPSAFRVCIHFFAPLPFFHWFALGPLLWLSYRKIYAEDEAMILTRQRELDRFKVDSNTPLKSVQRIGLYSEITKKLPYFFSHADRPYLLVMDQGSLKSFEGRCPHMLRPLQDAPIKNNYLRCPWHGYEFSLTTGHCQQAGLSLIPGPKIQVVGSEVFVQSLHIEDQSDES